MKKYLAFLILLGFETQAQTNVSDVSKERINMGTGLNSSKSSVFWGAPTELANTVGEVYLDTLWNSGSVRLTKGIEQFGGQGAIDTLTGLNLRYNVYRNELEVLANAEKKDVKAIQGDDLKSFSLKHHGRQTLFVNAQNLKTDKPLTGFYEVLADGKLTLVKHYWVQSIRPNYNAAFGTGDKNTRINIQDDYYVISNGKAEKISPGKKSVTAVMKDKEGTVSKYLKDNNVNYKSEDDLIRLFAFYNK